MCGFTLRDGNALRTVVAAFAAARIEIGIVFPIHGTHQALRLALTVSFNVPETATNP